MDDHRVDAPERGGQLGQLHGVDDGPAGRAASLDLEREHAAAHAGPELASGHVVLGMAGQARVQDRPDARLGLQPRRQARGRSRVPLGSDGEGEDPAEDEERVERTERGAGVDLDAPDLGDPLRRPGDDAGDHVAVAAQELGGGLDHEVGAERQRTADVGRGERVVDDVRRAVAVGELGQDRMVREVGRRIGDGLRVEDSGRGRGQRRLDRVDIGRVHHVDPDAEAAERPQELRPRGTVDRDRRHDPVAGLQERGERRVDRAHPGRERQPGLAAGQLGVRVTERGRRRVRDPAVGIAGAGIGGDPAELVGVARGERRGLVDRHARRHLVDAGSPRGGADGPGREAAEARLGARIGVAHGADATPESPIAPAAWPPPGSGPRPLRRIGDGDAGDPVLAGALAGVHRLVGADHQLVRGSAVAREADDADRQGWVRARRRLVDGHAADATPDLLGQDERAGRIGLGQEHDELVAAVSGGGVDLADAVGDHLADTAQDPVAVMVAEPVVDRLQVVEVHHQQAEPTPGPGAAGDLPADGGEEERPVEQARSAGRPSTAGSPRRACAAARGR